jgi:hypothetical protein
MNKENRRLGQLCLELNSTRLSSIIDEAVITSSEIVNFHLSALATADLSQPAEAADARHKFRRPPIGTAERRAMHERWILAKAFQELLRAVRHSLEEAHVFVALLTRKYRIQSSSSLAEFLRPFQSKAAGLKFPELLEAVNNKFDPKIDFAPAYVSLQSARNCLEHRDGVVSKIDTHGRESLILRVPRVKIFYLRKGAEVEIEPGHKIDPGDDRTEVQGLMKIEIRERSIALGERLTFTPAEFNEIAFACHLLGQQLSAKLATPKLVEVPSSA